MPNRKVPLENIKHFVETENAEKGCGEHLNSAKQSYRIQGGVR